MSTSIGADGTTESVPVPLTLTQGTEKFALLDRAGEAVLFRLPGRDVTAAEFLADANTLSAALPAATHVANICQDRYRFAVGLAACLLRGQISLLCDTSRPSLARLSQEYPGAYALGDSPVADLPLKLHIVAGGPAPVWTGPVPQLDPAQPALVVLTSGSTGAPVGTLKSWGELVTRSRAAAACFGFEPDRPTGLIGTVPPHHMYGLETTVLLPLHAPVACWCGPVFYPADIAAALAAVPGPRLLVTTPLHLRAVLRAGGLAPEPETVISATAPLERGLAAEVEAAWGTRVLEIFGASEVGSIAHRRTTEGDDWIFYPGVTLGGTSEAPLISAAFAAPRPLTDIIEPTYGGFRLIGRRGDMVKLAGRRASLLGLTRILTGLDGVQDAVFVAPDDLEQRPAARMAALAVAPGRTARQVTEALRSKIDPVFLPRPLVLVEKLPRDALGKLPRAQLLAMLKNAGDG